MRLKIAYLFLIVFSVAVFPLNSVTADADYVFSQNGYSSLFSLKSPEIKVIFKTSFDKDGRFDINAPFSFSMDIAERIKLGELKPNGIVLQMLQPYETSSYIKGFCETRFRKVYTPSLTAQYNGIVINLKQMEMFSLMGNKLGFGFSVGNDNCFASVLLLNNSLSCEEISSVIVDWNDLEGKTQCLMAIGGVNSYAYLKNFSFSGDFFIRTVIDMCSGSDMTVGMDLKLSHRGNSITYRKRLGKKGDKTIFEFKYRNALISYSDMIGPQPSFMGLSQERETDYKVSFDYGKCGISNTLHLDMTKKGESKTSQKAVFYYKESAFRMQIETDLESFAFSFSDSRCNILYRNKQAHIEYFFPIDFSENLKGKFSINQSRQISASFRYVD